MIQQAPRVSYVQVSQTLFGPWCPLTYVREKKPLFQEYKDEFDCDIQMTSPFSEKGFVAMTIICFLQKFKHKLHLFSEFLIYA